MKLIGNKVIIRNFKESDLKRFLELVGDEENHQLAGLEYTEDENFGQDLLNMYMRREGAFVISTKLDDEMVGIIELNKRGESEYLLSSREIGFVINRRFRRLGYAKESLQLLIDYGFQKLGLKELWASTEESNEAPQRLLKTLEFRYVYEFNQAFPYTGEQNTVKYYLLKK